MLLWLSGCSVFVATPKTTRVQVTGFNNQVNEYIIVTDEPEEADLDIKLSGRYAIHFDFQWLWNDLGSSMNENPPYFWNEWAEQPMTPWFTCKYKF